jgi:O-antigen ligase
VSLEHLEIAALVLAAYQLYVTLRVLFAIQYTKVQRLLQLALIWLIPLFGAIVCHVFLVSDAQRPRPRDTAFTQAPENPPGGSQEGSH